MIDPARLQAFLAQKARAICSAHAVTPFTIFLHHGDRTGESNYAIPTGTLNGDLLSAIAAMRSLFAAHGCRARVVYVEACAPALGHTLREAGFREVARRPLLSCMPDLLREPPTVPGLVVVTLTDQASIEDVRESLEVNERGFDPETTAVFSDEEVIRFRRDLVQARAFTARLDGQPVGAGMFVAPHDGLTELVGIATLAPFRGRGIAGTLTAAAAGTAFAQGVGAVFLSAADEGAGRVYERVGFRPNGTLLMYEDGLG